MTDAEKIAAPESWRFVNLSALRELIEALEEHAAGRPLPRGMDRYDLLELAKAVEKRP